MKINSSFIQNVLKVYDKQSKNNKVTNKGRLSKKDELKLSTEAKEFQTAMKALKNVPDVRKDKVEDIRQRITSGTYNISSRQIAKKMIENANMNVKYNKNK